MSSEWSPIGDVKKVKMVRVELFLFRYLYWVYVIMRIFSNILLDLHLPVHVHSHTTVAFERGDLIDRNRKLQESKI